MTDVGVKESGDELAWEWTGAVSSPCRRRKFSFCSSSFLLIKAWRDEDELRGQDEVLDYLLHDVLGEHSHLLGARHPRGLGGQVRQGQQ